MCRNYIYWVTEFLNYWSLAFCGFKLFIRRYDIQLIKSRKIGNVIIGSISIPIAMFSAGNFKYVEYSNPVTYILTIYVYLLLVLFAKNRMENAFSLIAIYVNSMRLIDLWIVAVISEVSRVSRYVSLLSLIHI